MIEFECILCTLYR